MPFVPASRDLFDTHAGTVKGAVAGEAFNQALTRIWLGDKPVQSDLKKSLLGG